MKNAKLFLLFGIALIAFGLVFTVFAGAENIRKSGGTFGAVMAYAALVFAVIGLGFAIAGFVKGIVCEQREKKQTKDQK